MPGQDGLHAIRRIREAAPNTAVAVVTANCEPVWISRAAQAGASAFILKDGSLIEMMDVLRRVRHGQLIVAPAAFRRGPSTTNRSLANVPTLTPRELEVLTYLGRAMPAVGIARVLGITVNTCRGHLKALHSKLGAASQLEAVIKAQQMGLITTS
jgi:DNA-binding NarL/FixJ family response regulator